MDLSKILSIAGKPGLFKVLHQTRSGVVVVSLTDGKKMSIGQTQRVSTLSDISVYKVDGDEPLKNIFESMLAYGKGAQLDIDVKDDNGLRSFFEEIIPDFDKDRVYTSDIRKIVKWYNTLLEKGLLEPSEEDEKKEEETPAKAKKSPAKDGETASGKEVETETKEKAAKPKAAKKAPAKKAPAKKAELPKAKPKKDSSEKEE